MNHPETTSMFAVDENRPDLGGNLRSGDPWTFTPALWRHLVDRFGISSVLDVGCGEGHTTKFFHRLGVLAFGIDGLRTNVDRAVYPIAQHDLLARPFYMPVDLVWCCEVAEHIQEDKVDNLLDTLVNGRVIAMTHAVPGQDGYHHVNCQPAEYWIERIQSRGYLFHWGFNDIIRRVAVNEGHENHFSTKGLVFFRK